jgi:hypothetical protein
VPTCELLTPSGLGDSRAALPTSQDMAKFRAPLLAAYSRQAERAIVVDGVVVVETARLPVS